MGKNQTETEVACTLSTVRTGYNGQRYEVQFTDGEGLVKVFGWTNDSDGGLLCASVKAHPEWHSPRIVDLRAEGIQFNCNRR